MAGVRLKQLTKQYSLAGQSSSRLDNADAPSLKSAASTVIVGKSGCGHNPQLLRL